MQFSCEQGINVHKRTLPSGSWE